MITDIELQRILRASDIPRNRFEPTKMLRFI